MGKHRRRSCAVSASRESRRYRVDFPPVLAVICLNSLNARRGKQVDLTERGPVATEAHARRDVDQLVVVAWRLPPVTRPTVRRTDTGRRGGASGGRRSDQLRRLLAPAAKRDCPYGVVVRTLATFRLFGEPPHTARAVTDILGLAPTRAHEAGDPVSRRSPAVRGSSAWLLQSANKAEDGVELSTQLHRLLQMLEPVAEQLWQLVQQGYEASWFCYISSSAMEHAVELDRDLLSRLLRLPGDLWLDVTAPR